MKFIALCLVVLIIFAIAMTFGANNDQVVTFNYLINQGEFRLSTLLACLLGLGFLLGWLIMSFFYITTRFKLSATKRKLIKIEKRYDIELASNRKQQLAANTKASELSK